MRRSGVLTRWQRSPGIGRLTALALLLLSPVAVTAQPSIDPQGVTVNAVSRLRFAQEAFPAASDLLEGIIVRFERSTAGTDGEPLVVDSCHLRPAPQGLMAWIEARQGVLAIDLALERANAPALPLPPALQRILADVRDDVIEVYRFLAEVALQEGRGLGDAPSSRAQLDRAEKAFADAEAELAAGDHAGAMQALRQAWEHALLAVPDAAEGERRPQINIEQPLDGAVLFEPSIEVAGMVQLLGPGTVGADDVAVSVNGQPAEVVHRSFMARDVPLREGLNALVATAESTAGARGTSCLAVVLDPTARPGIEAVSGQDQTGEIGTELPLPLGVQVRNPAGDPLPGAQVIFRVVRGDGSLEGGRRSAVVEGDAQGVASIAFTLGNRAGVAVNRVRATAVGVVGEAVFAPTATTGTPRSINGASGDNQAGGVGEPLARPLVVFVTDSGQNPVAGAAVTFEVVAGGGSIGGDSEAVVLTDSDGLAGAELTLGLEEGLDSQQVRASFAGLANEAVLFKASAYVTGAPADTGLSGVVQDNQGDPVPGVTLSVLGTDLRTTADAEGQFSLVGVPVGDVMLHADATTATRPGTWASLTYDLHTVAGIDNRLVKPIYILPLDLANGKIAGGPEDVTIEVPEVPGFSLTVLAGSATFPDGSKTGLVSVTSVHPDKIPRAPGFGMQPRFIVTIQPAGTTFDPPAPVAYPNVDGLAPGTVAEMFSFDHDLGQFVSIGTGTVSEDGTVVRSDPGFGVVKAGWHCAAPQSGSGAGASLHVAISTSEPVIPCRDEMGMPIPVPIEAGGGPPRDAEYTWESTNSSVVSLDPSGGGLCADQSQCNTMASAGSDAGVAMAKVTITCTTTGATDEDEIKVLNPGVEVMGVDVCGNTVTTHLEPSDPDLTCPLILSMVEPGGTKHEFLNEDRAGGDYTDPIDFDALPVQVEFTEVEAEWRCGTCMVGPRDRADAHFLSLGHIRHTAYNCPSAGDATCTGGGNVDVCFTNAGCGYNGPDPVPQTWLTQVTGAAQGTGCGSVPGHGTVQIEEFCLLPAQLAAFPPPPLCAGLAAFREGGAINGHCGGAVGATTVAVDDVYLTGLLPCGTDICIFNNGAAAGIEKSVADRCPGCGAGRIDNFSNAGTCGIGDFAPDAVTLRLY